MVYVSCEDLTRHLLSPPVMLFRDKRTAKQQARIEELFNAVDVSGDGRLVRGLVVATAFAITPGYVWFVPCLMLCAVLCCAVRCCRQLKAQFKAVAAQLYSEIDADDLE